MERLDTSPRTKPSKRRPLLGNSLLLVEDSRYCSEAVRLFSKASGARMRRADSLASAHRHMSTFRPDAVIVDIGLPDGDGLEFLTELSKRSDPRPGLIAISGDVDQTTRQAATQAGAAVFLAKPLSDLRAFQRAVVMALGDASQDARFVPQLSGVRGPDLDPQALLDDIDRMQRLLLQAMAEQDRGGGIYAAQFACSIATVAGDEQLLSRARKLQQGLISKRDWMTQSNDLLETAQQRLHGVTSF